MLETQRLSVTKIESKHKRSALVFISLAKLSFNATQNTRKQYIYIQHWK